MCVEITDTPKLWRKYVETWVFAAVSGQWPLGKNIRGWRNWIVYPTSKRVWYQRISTFYAFCNVKLFHLHVKLMASSAETLISSSRNFRRWLHLKKSKCQFLLQWRISCQYRHGFSLFLSCKWDIFPYIGYYAILHFMVKKSCRNESCFMKIKLH